MNDDNTFKTKIFKVRPEEFPGLVMSVGTTAFHYASTNTSEVAFFDSRSRWVTSMQEIPEDFHPYVDGYFGDSTLVFSYVPNEIIEKWKA